MTENLSGQHCDDYLLLKHLGKGYYGDVYLAEHVYLKMRVAIKILSAQIDKDHFDQLADFLKEARAFRLQHPNIVRISDFGITPQGNSFLVMNYMPNGNLRQRHPRKTQVPWEKVVSYTQQIAEALQYIHDLGIVHRDVKPENMLVGLSGEIVLGDFGIATTSYTWDASRTQIPQGTPLYIAPEQSRGHAVRTSDQYALGVVMYELLAGRPPFEGTIEGVLRQHREDSPPPLRDYAPDLLPRAEAVIMQMLEKDPQARFASMREFLAALERVQTHSLPIKPVVFNEHIEGVRCVGWSHDGRYIASAGRDKTVLVWDTATGSVVYAYHRHTDEIWHLAWSPDSRFVASAGADRTVQVWEATTGYAAPVYDKHRDVVRAVSWSHDGRYLASASDDRTVHVWDVSKGLARQMYRQHGCGVYAVSWSPADDIIASGDENGEIHLWNDATATHPFICRGHTLRITSPAWSPDGCYLASASDDGTVCIWDVATRRLQQRYTGHKDVVAAVAWSPRSSTIASGSWDNTIHVWNLGEEEAHFIYRSHQSWVNAVSWSPDGRHLVSGSWDKTARIFLPH